MAYIITAKYADGLPLYSLSPILQRHGIHLSRQALSESVIAAAQKTAHSRHLLNHGHVMHMDETTVQVLNEPGKAPQSKSYMWVQRGGLPGQTIALFNYKPRLYSLIPEKLLAHYQGVLMTDGFTVYRQVAAKKQLTHLCCWAHARRKFVDA